MIGIKLTPHNFQDFTSEGHWLVAITSTNCGLCTNIFDFVLKFLKKYPTLNYGYIDALEYPEMNQAISFHAGVPTGHIVFGGRTCKKKNFVFFIFLFFLFFLFFFLRHVSRNIGTKWSSI